MNRLLTALCVLTIAAPAEQDPNVLKVDALFAQFTRPGSPGCAVGVMRDGALILAKGYGVANLEHNIPISSSTVFDLASTSKQFTAAAVVQLARDGKLSLDDDVRKFIPELPDYGRPITIRHLLHHTSGLRDYLVLFALSGINSDGVTGDDEALRIIAAQKKLNFAPGDEHLYSNSGYFLLSIVVKRASGQTLRQYAAEKIFGPLGMKSTFFRDKHDEVVRGRATGYSRRPMTGFRVDMSGFEQTGDGAVHTNVEDLVAWDNGDRWRSLLERGKLNNGRVLDYAMGLNVGTHRGLAAIHHGGSWAGYRSEFIRFPEKRLSVACLCNLAESNPVQLARRVADIYLGFDVPPPAERRSDAPPKSAVSTAELSRYEGIYADLDRSAFRKVSLVNGGLEVDTYGFGRYGLKPLGEGRFQLLGAPFPLEMIFDAETVTIQGRGPAEVLRKQNAAETATTTEYGGVYESPELPTRYQVKAETNAIEVRPLFGSPRRLPMVVRDHFAGPGLHLRFERGPDGRITGFTINAGRVRGIQVTRIAGSSSADRP